MLFRGRVRAVRYEAFIPGTAPGEVDQALTGGVAYSYVSSVSVSEPVRVVGNMRLVVITVAFRGRRRPEFGRPPITSVLVGRDGAWLSRHPLSDGEASAR